MFDAVKDKAILLMEFDQHLLEKETEKTKSTKMPAVQLLVKNTDAIPVSYSKQTNKQICDLFLTNLNM